MTKLVYHQNFSLIRRLDHKISIFQFGEFLAVDLMVLCISSWISFFYIGLSMRSRHVAIKSTVRSSPRHLLITCIFNLNSYLIELIFMIIYIIMMHENI